jgi:hypothetical protein
MKKILDAGAPKNVARLRTECVEALNFPGLIFFFWRTLDVRSPSGAANFKMSQCDWWAADMVGTRTRLHDTSEPEKRCAQTDKHNFFPPSIIGSRGISTSPTEPSPHTQLSYIPHLVPFLFSSSSPSSKLFQLTRSLIRRNNVFPPLPRPRGRSLHCLCCPH